MSWCLHLGKVGRFLACGFLLSFSAIVAKAQPKDDETGGFFSYFPAPSDIRLPKIEIVPFWASDLKVGRKAYNDREFKRALKYLRKASEDGSATADWYLGNMYRLGLGIKIDDAVAYTYYSRVVDMIDEEGATKGHLKIAIDSQLRLANYHRKGISKVGVVANPQSAARVYLRLASNYGHPGAMFALGEMNVGGEGVQRNPQQGLKWLMAAARKRSVEAQARLGDLYEEGSLVRPDETRSLMWYILAAEKASDIEHAKVLAHAKQKYANATQEVRLEADARARVWSEQFPLSD